jgi:hypothetical protein
LRLISWYFLKNVRVPTGVPQWMLLSYFWEN